MNWWVLGVTSEQTGPEERIKTNSSPERRNYKGGGGGDKQMASVVKSEFQTFKILLVLIISEAYQRRAVGEG